MAATQVNWELGQVSEGEAGGSGLRYAMNISERLQKAPSSRRATWPQCLEVYSVLELNALPLKDCSVNLHFHQGFYKHPQHVLRMKLEWTEQGETGMVLVVYMSPS